MEDDKKEQPSMEGSGPQEEEGKSQQETPETSSEEDSPSSKKIIVLQDLDSVEQEPSEDPEDSGGTVEIDKKELKELREKAGQAEKNLSYAQRALADLENYRRRVQKEKEMALLMVKKDLMGDFLPIIDNLERAIDAAGRTEKVGDILAGMKIIESEISKFFINQNMVPIEAIGQPFDPHLHEAMGEIQVADQKPGTVVHQITRGYQWGDYVLRHSQVMVARGGEEAGKEESSPSPEEDVPPSDQKGDGGNPTKES